MQPARVRILLEPVAQPWPLPQQRLVRDLDLAVADRDQPLGGQDVETCATASPSNSLSRARRRTTSVALALAGQPQQDPPGQRPTRGVEPLVGLLGQPRDRPVDAPGLLVVDRRSVRPSRRCHNSSSADESSGRRTGLALDVG